jgi:large subunit ribosomal protein L15
MMIHEITQKVGRHKARMRVGRGESSGLGKTSGRGHKGAASRSGWSLRPAYMGGQINFIQKLPKRGFSNAPFRKMFHIVNVKAIDAFAKTGDEVTVESLAAAGIISDAELPLKVLGEGEITKKVTVTAAKFSASAKAKIEKAGGTVNEVKTTTWNRDPEAWALKQTRRAEAKVKALEEARKPKPKPEPKEKPAKEAKAPKEKSAEGKKDKTQEKPPKKEE